MVTGTLSPELDALARRYLQALAHTLGWREAGVRTAPERQPESVRVRFPLAALRPAVAGAPGPLLSPALLWTRRPWGDSTRPSRLTLQRGRVGRMPRRTPERTPPSRVTIQRYAHEAPVLDPRGGLWTTLASLWPPAARRLETFLTTWWLTYRAPDGRIGTLHLTLGLAPDGTPRYWTLDTFAPRATWTADVHTLIAPLTDAGELEAALEHDPAFNALRARCLAHGVGLLRPRAHDGR